MRGSSNAVVALLADIQREAARLGGQGVPVQGLQQAVETALGAAKYAEMAQPLLRTTDESHPLATGILRTPGVTSVATGITSVLYPINWTFQGIVVGICCATVENTAAAHGAMSTRITTDSNRDLFSGGTAGGAFAHFATTFVNGANNPGWFPCFIPVTRGSSWQQYFKNESATGPYTPVSQFKYVSLEE